MDPLQHIFFKSVDITKTPTPIISQKCIPLDMYTNKLQIYLKPLSLKRLLVLFPVKYLSLNFYRELLRARLNMAGSPAEIRPAAINRTRTFY